MTSYWCKYDTTMKVAVFKYGTLHIGHILWSKYKSFDFLHPEKMDWWFNVSGWGWIQEKDIVCEVTE